jgi:hypothetical protein
LPVSKRSFTRAYRRRLEREPIGVTVSDGVAVPNPSSMILRGWLSPCGMNPRSLSRIRTPLLGLVLHAGTHYFELSWVKARDFFGEDVKPQVIKFSTTSGRAEWTGEKKVNNRDVVFALFDEGMSQSEIVKTTGLTKGRISQLKREWELMQARKRSYS